jgi:hypothetical protein
MTLNSLNYATNVPSGSDPEEGIVTLPDGMEYGEDFDPQAKYQTGELDDEFVAAGWSGPVVTDQSGSPVRFAD